MIGSFAASHAKLPPAPAEERRREEGRSRQGRRGQGQGRRAELGKAQDKAVANYKKNKGVAMGPAKAASKAAKK